jgi:Oxidoreductase family, NAD-binding Rossmann fold
VASRQEGVIIVGTCHGRLPAGSGSPSSPEAAHAYDMSRIRIVLIGAGFIVEIHTEAYHRVVPDAELVGVYSRTEDHARAFAHKHGIKRWFVDLEQTLGRVRRDRLSDPYWWSDSCSRGASDLRASRERIVTRATLRMRSRLGGRATVGARSSARWSALLTSCSSFRAAIVSTPTGSSAPNDAQQSASVRGPGV